MLANVYCPNKRPQKYLKGILNILTDFKQRHLILARDFNFSIDQELDSTSRAPNRENKQLKLVKKKLYSQQLTYGEHYTQKKRLYILLNGARHVLEIRLNLTRSRNAGAGYGSSD